MQENKQDLLLLGGLYFVISLLQKKTLTQSLLFIFLGNAKYNVETSTHKKLLSIKIDGDTLLFISHKNTNSIFYCSNF
jgi:hypothetical protein